MQDLGTFGGSSSSAMAINSNGEIVGVADDATFNSHVFLWTSGGGMQDLGILGGNLSIPSHLNNNGEVVGGSYIDASNGYPFLWTSGEGVQDLGTLTETRGDGLGINSNGQVVGQIYTPGGDSKAFLWEDSVGMQDLNDLVDPDSGWTLTGASGINDSGLIVGSGTFGGQTRAFLLTPISSSATPLPPAMGLFAVGAAGLGFLRLLNGKMTL